MFKLITATLLATAAASLTMPHVDDLRKLQEEHLELARHLLATNPMHTLSEASHLRVVSFGMCFIENGLGRQAKLTI